MVIGHESAGTVTALGAGVTSLALGDRVAMEPGAGGVTRAIRSALNPEKPVAMFCIVRGHHRATCAVPTRAFRSEYAAWLSSPRVMPQGMSD